MHRGSTRVYVHHLDFQYNDFLYVFSVCCQKMAFVCEFQHTPRRKMIFFSMFHTSCGVWDFGGMYLTHLETRIWRGSFHIYFKKWFFWPSKLCCPLRVQGKKLFFVNFERYDLANGEEWVCKIWWTCRHRS
jgi:hypothetical protein